MTELVVPPSPSPALFPAPPSTPSLKPALRAALSDGFGGRWEAAAAVDIAGVQGSIAGISVAMAVLEASMLPPDRAWFGKRLTVLWNLFNATRTGDPRALAGWMAETIRLLDDLPHDIVAQAIDAAIKSSGHGFMPSVGEIRQHAAPLVEERARQLQRLRLMLEIAPATAAPVVPARLR